MIKILKKFIRKIVFSIIKPPVVNNSYSQAGEDAILRFLFSQKKVKTPTYLELGTSNPIHGNNTYLFYSLGSRGVCVEADQTLIEKIKKSRPGDKVINVGVGVGESAEADFYIFNEPSLNTFDHEEALNREAQGTYKIARIVKTPLVSLEDLINKNFSGLPDFLSIDIEGLDLLVLKSIDLAKYPIPVICAETCEYSENHVKAKNKDIEKYMLNNGYFVYADTYINTIFVNKSWFF